MSISAKSRSRRGRAVLGCLLAAIAALALTAPPALALSKHVFSASFSGSGTNALSNPSDVEVDQASGDIYVTDPANFRVEKFDSGGNFILMFGKEVDATTGGDVCTAASGDTCQAGQEGNTPGAFVEPRYLAVDNSGGPSSGDVYVADAIAANKADVQKFDSSGNLVTSWGKGGLLDGSENPDRITFTGFPGRGHALSGVAVDPSGKLWVAAGVRDFEYTESGGFIADPGQPEGNNLVVDGDDNLYFIDALEFDSILQRVSAGGGVWVVQNPGIYTGLGMDVPGRDLYISNSDGSVEVLAGSCNFSSAPCVPVDSFGTGHLSEPKGVAVDDSSGTAYVADASGSVVTFSAVPYLPDALTSATPLTPTTERLGGSVDPAGAGPVSACNFEYGTDETYGSGSIGCNPTAPITAETEVTNATDLSGLQAGSTYHYRLTIENANGPNPSYDRTFTTLPLAPVISGDSISDVHADSATVQALINPGGGEATYHTTYHVEYVSDEAFQAGGFTGAAHSSTVDAGSGKSPQALSTPLSGLLPGTTYHYRVVAENASGTAEGPPRTFTTLPFSPSAGDPCPNAHVRQQTGAAGLLDCRAYELASAPDSGGYDVESSLVPGQTPFGGFPEAEGRLLYGVHDGGIPGTGSPTNRGVDPYVAIRGEGGWSTRYVGIPAAGTPSDAPFSSALVGADAKLDTFAFGGPEICSPCFANGETGIPVHEPDESLVQGMAGSEDPGPSAKASEVVAKPLSANGEHLIFASTSRFEPDGNEGDVSIYDRNLKTGTTHVVSKTPGDATMTGAPIAELDVSDDGTRVLIGQLVSEAEGDRHYHLYMNVGDSSGTVDLTPGTTTGVLYAGMSADGSKVFFTTEDSLVAEDGDESADLYEASVAGQSATSSLLSTGSEGTGNSDSCDPAANSAHVHWNTKSPKADCGVVAIGGGGGVASGNGTVYFLSPERLDGSANGTENAPNLYVVHPGSAPRFITTLESAFTGPQPPEEGRNFLRNFGSFAGATGIAVDESNGDIYVADAKANAVEKFDSAGNLITSFGDSAPQHDGKLVGSETLAGSFAEAGESGLPAQLAVDQSTGDLYVPDVIHGVIDKFKPSGEFLSEVHVEFASSVAVDPANGNLYASSFFGHVFVFDSSGDPVSEFSPGGLVRGLAVTAAGKVYVSNGQETNIYKPNGELEGQLDPRSSAGIAIDTANGDLYIDEGNQVARFNSAGAELETFGAGRLNGSVGLALKPGGHLYASNGHGVADFSPFGLLSNPAVDSPVVIDSVSEAAARHTGDFQLTPDGEYAAFDSTLDLGDAGEETAGHSEIYRYASSAGRLNCVSCATTGVAPVGDSSLADDGLSLADDGRIFFDSPDPLVAADTDGRQDVYEASEPGVGTCSGESSAYRRTSNTCLALISAGTSPFDSGLLTVTSDGRDAFFFTRDSLAPQDQNGATMKVYDAREEGGFPYVNPAVQCQASDECHGTASAPPPPLQASSVAGTPGNVAVPGKKPHKHKHSSHKHKRRHEKKSRHKKASHKRGGGK